MLLQERDNKLKAEQAGDQLQAVQRDRSDQKNGNLRQGDTSSINLFLIPCSRVVCLATITHKQSNSRFSWEELSD